MPVMKASILPDRNARLVVEEVTLGAGVVEAVGPGFPGAPCAAAARTASAASRTSATSPAG